MCTVILIFFFFGYLAIFKTVSKKHSLFKFGFSCALNGGPYVYMATKQTCTKTYNNIFTSFQIGVLECYDRTMSRVLPN